MRVSDMNIDRIYINSLARSASYKMVENHFHYYYELYYLRNGSSTFYINNTLYDLHSGEFLIIPPREVHFNHYLSQCVRINLYFNESDLPTDDEPLMKIIKDRFLKICLVHIPGSYRSTINNVFDSMLSEEKVDDESTAKMMRLLLQQLFIYCNRFCIMDYDGQGNAKDGNEGILEAGRFISENFNQQITLDSMAKLAGLSPSYFSKKFQLVTGMGMKEYLVYVRLKHAALELLSTSHTITEVAANCGFGDSNYFKDAFKKTYGLSPRAYRNSKKTDYILEKSLAAQK